MATSYDRLIKRFLRKIKDYNLLELDDELKDDDILELLDSAIGFFERLCKNDLSLRDDNLREFELDLSSLEINIITELMAQEWIQPYQNHTDLLEHSMTTRDFSEYDSKGKLGAVSALAERIEKKCEKLMKDYSYNFGGMDEVGL